MAWTVALSTIRLYARHSKSYLGKAKAIKLNQTQLNSIRSNSIEPNPRIEFDYVRHSNFSKLFIVFLLKWSGGLWGEIFQTWRDWDETWVSLQICLLSAIEYKLAIRYSIAGLTEGLKFSKEFTAVFFWLFSNPFSSVPPLCIRVHR